VNSFLVLSLPFSEFYENPPITFHVIVLTVAKQKEGDEFITCQKWQRQYVHVHTIRIYNTIRTYNTTFSLMFWLGLCLTILLSLFCML